jgi:hypothetical protein
MVSEVPEDPVEDVDFGIDIPSAISPIAIDKDGTGVSPEIARAAQETAKAGAAQQKLIDGILERLSSKEEQKQLGGDSAPPTFEECIADPAFADTLLSMDAIVSKYETGEFKMIDLDKDILKLGALLFYLSGRVNSIEMAAIDAETGMKSSISRAFLKAKDMAGERKSRISDELAKAVAIVATDGIRNKSTYKRVLAHAAKDLYYAGAQLLKMMNDISRRAFTEKFQAGQI